MAFNVLTGSVSAVAGILASGSFTGSFGGNGADLENVKQFDLFGDVGSGKIAIYKAVNGKTQLQGDSNLFYDVANDILTVSKMTASSGIHLSGISAGQTDTSSFLALDSNNNIILTSSSGILTSSSGRVSALNNAVANRLITFGADTTELDGEANLTFDGNFLSLQGGLVLKRRQISTHITASSTDYYVGISASANLDIRLPGSETLTSGQTFVFKDEIGTAGTHTIKIITSGSQTIDGSSNIRLESPFAAINLYSDGTSKYFIF